MAYCCAGALPGFTTGRVVAVSITVLSIAAAAGLSTAAGAASTVGSSVFSASCEPQAAMVKHKINAAASILIGLFFTKFCCIVFVLCGGKIGHKISNSYHFTCFKGATLTEKVVLKFILPQF